MTQKLWLSLTLMFVAIVGAPTALCEPGIRVVNARDKAVDIWIDEELYGVLPARSSCLIDKVRVATPDASHTLVTSIAHTGTRLMVASVILDQSMRESSTIVIGSTVRPVVGHAAELSKTALFQSNEFVRDRFKMLQGLDPRKPLSIVDRQNGTMLDDLRVTGDLVSVHLGEVVYVHNSLGMLFRRIPKGTYVVGTAAGKPGQGVTISKDYYLAITEFSRRERGLLFNEAVDEATASLPATMLTWQDAVDICTRLGATDNQRYRLPSESEWERAAFAGGSAPFSPNGKPSSDIMWWGRNSGNKTHAIATKLPNDYGLYDMHGNVREWCTDRWTAFRIVGNDPTGPATGTQRVRRGGGYESPDYWSGADYRDAGPPNIAQPFQGVRVLMEVADDPR